LNLTTRHFEWESTLTLSHHQDRWIKHFPGWTARPYEGPNDPIRALYEYVSLGLLQPGQQPPASQSTLLPGGVVNADLNNDGVINDYDVVYLGNKDPALIYGLNNALRYTLNNKYKFDFNIYFYGESGLFGGSYKLGNVLMGEQGGSNVSIGAFNVFRHNNLESVYINPLARSLHWGNYYTHKIFFIRCGSITLGCTLPVTKIVEKIRVYVDIANPFIITNYDGVDPETELSLATASAYPNVKSFNVGVNITF
jgi:hypothetical protein